MDRKSLLKELDRLSHAQRIRRVTGLALENSENPKLSKLLDSFSSSSYETRLALTMAGVLGDVERVLKALSHTCPFVRRTAATLAAKLSKLRGERLVSELEVMDQQTRRLLLRKVRQKNRRDLAEALLTPVWEKFGPQEAALLLSALEPETLRDKLPELAHLLKSWTTIAGRYPDLILEYLNKTLSNRSVDFRSRVWSNLSAAFEPLVFKRCEQLLCLIEETAPAQAYPNHLRIHWAVLTRSFPSRIAEFLSRKELQKESRQKGLPEPVLRNFRAFEKSDRLRLGQTQKERPESFALLLEAITPGERGPLFDEVLEGLDCSQKIWPERVMRLLPHPFREREAKRMLALKTVVENDSLRVQVLAYLPPEQMRKALVQDSRSPKAEERAAALSSMVRSSALYRSDLTTSLETLQRLKNEQDPVRLAVITELSKVSGSDFKLEHRDYLMTLVLAVVDARDSSHGTRRALSGMLTRILQSHDYPSEMFDFALNMLEKLGWQGFQLEMQEVFNFEPERCRLLIQKLLPLVTEAVQRESYDLLFALARFKPALQMQDLQKLLERATEAKREWTARQAISHWLKDPKTRDQRVQKLLRADPSHIVIWDVLRHLHLRRQDLLDPYLSQKAVKGRFLDGKTIQVLSLSEGFEKWLPRQQEDFAKRLLSLAEDKEQALSTRSDAVQRLGRLPDLSTNPAESFIQSSEQTLREASLALPGLDPERLLAFFERDEARVAAYSLSTALRRSPPQRVEKVLEKAFALPLKVTAHKELIRILGQCRGAYSLHFLEREWEQENLHRDVRIAALHAARNLLDSPRAWNILGQAAQGPNTEIHRSLLTQGPGDLLPSHKLPYLKLLLSLQHSAELKLRQELWPCFSLWTEVDPESIAKASAYCLASLDRPDWARACDSLVLCCREGQATDHLLSASSSLYSQLNNDPQATPERDRPARQRLNYLAHLLLNLADPFRQNLKDCFSALGPLCEDPELIFRLRWAAGLGLESLYQSCTGGYEEQHGLLRAFNSEWSRAKLEPEEFLQSALYLSSKEHNLARRLAVEALLHAGPRLGWSEPCRNLLLRLRQDSASDVALAAGRIFISQEN